MNKDDIVETLDEVEQHEDQAEQQRRDEKHGLYGGREDVAN